MNSTLCILAVIIIIIILLWYFGRGKSKENFAVKGDNGQIYLTGTELCNFVINKYKVTEPGALKECTNNLKINGFVAPILQKCTIENNSRQGMKNCVMDVMQGGPTEWARTICNFLAPSSEWDCSSSIASALLQCLPNENTIGGVNGCVANNLVGTTYQHLAAYIS